MVHKVFSRLGGKLQIQSSLHVASMQALSPGLRLIPIPCYPVNEVESNHQDQALGICYTTFFSIVYRNGQDRELWLASKLLIAPTLQSAMLSCMMPVRICVCEREEESSEITQAESKWLLHIRPFAVSLCKPTQNTLKALMFTDEPKWSSNTLPVKPTLWCCTAPSPNSPWK